MSWRYIKEYLWTESWNPDRLPVLYGNIHISGIHYVFPTNMGLGRALMFRSIRSFFIRSIRARAPNYFLNYKELVWKCLLPPPTQISSHKCAPPNLKVAPRSLGHPRAFELLKSLLVKFPAHGIRLLVKCLAMLNDLCSNVPAPGTRKIGFCWFVRLIDSTVALFTHKTIFVFHNQNGTEYLHWNTAH